VSEDAEVARLPRSLAELPIFAAGRYPRPDLIGRATAAGIETTGSRELADRVRDLALGFGAIGIGPGDRVALLAESSPDWLTTDFAILARGAITVPIYPTSSDEQVAFILRDSGARAVVVSSAAQLAKVRAATALGGSVETLIAIDPAAVSTDPGGAISLADLAERGHRRILDGWGVGKAYRDEVRAVGPDDPATIVYTSGTTGSPKGVVLTHANLLGNVDGVLQVLALGPDDVALSFLPLSHVFERTVAFIFMTSGVSTIFAESPETVGRDLKLVRPTVMTGVPRAFEKLYARVLAGGQQATGLRRRIFDMAVETALERGRALAAGRDLPAMGRVRARIAERLVFQKIREAVGGRLRFAVSGSAPLRADVAAFFAGVGIPLLEGYGLTEAAPVLTVVREGEVRLGTVGRPLPNVELRIADDGEILARGPNVMAGYYQQPEATANVLRDGWLHTGDIGHLDEAGDLRITDRKKDLIVTSGGKKFPPQPIEQRLRAHPLVAEAVVIGECRHFPSALLVPDVPELCRATGEQTPTATGALRTLLDRPDVRARFERVVDEVNRDLARFEQIKRFTLIAREFTVEGGELSQTLKVRRRVVEERYRNEIESMYAG